jgi:8-oxo-dGTP pyrophosphatase MutT (NUDIX family)
MFFLKNLQFLFVALSVLLKIEAADVQAQVIVPASLNTKLNGLDHKIDSYKNIVITLKTPSNGAVNQLKRVMAEMQKSYKNYGLYVQIPVNHGDFSTKLENIGLKFCESDTTLKTLTYLYANGRNIPELNYAYTAAAVYLLRNNPETGAKEILIINEQQKTIANIIGGISEKGESPEETVIRETREEVSITLNKDKLKLVAVAHTVRPDKKSLVEFLYVCDEFEGTPKVDGKEVSECTWVPVSNLLKEGVKIFEKPFSPFWQRFLKNEFKE